MLKNISEALMGGPGVSHFKFDFNYNQSYDGIMDRYATSKAPLHHSCFVAIRFYNRNESGLPSLSNIIPKM